MRKIYLIPIIAIIIITFLIFNINNDSNVTNDNDWSYDKNEYPKNEYRLDELPVSHKSAYEVRQFFEDSDSDNDGVLKDREINTFDYKIKHSQYTFNGPYGYS